MKRPSSIMVRAVCLVLILLFVAWPSATEAAVTIQFSNGGRETFESVQRAGDKLVCRTKYGTVSFSASQLALRDRARFFPESVPAATPPPHTPAPTATEQEPKPDGLQPLQKHALDRDHPRYEVPPSVESAQLYVRYPRDADRSRKSGLLVYLGSTDETSVPAGWENALDSASLVFVAPRNAGNDQPAGHRYALASLALSQFLESGEIDPERVYVAGDSGGARLATMLGYYEAGRVRGVIASSGVNFHEAVPVEKAEDDSPYGLAPAEPAEAERARTDVVFVFLTGSNDRRQAWIRGIVEGGFKPRGFRAHLIDVPEMAHGPCPASALSEAIRLIEAPGAAENVPAPPDV